MPYLADSGRRRIGASAAMVNLEPAGAAAFDRDLAALLAERFSGEEVEAPHRVSVLVARAPG